MQKISVAIDVSKINKDTMIVEREYRNKEGETVKVKELRFDLVEKKEPRIIKEGDGWTLKDTHFAVEQQTKEERLAKKESNFIGSGTQFVEPEILHSPSFGEPTIDDIVNGTSSNGEINLEDIPF